MTRPSFATPCLLCSPRPALHFFVCRPTGTCLRKKIEERRNGFSITMSAAMADVAVAIVGSGSSSNAASDASSNAEVAAAAVPKETLDFATAMETEECTVAELSGTVSVFPRSCHFLSAELLRFNASKSRGERQRWLLRRHVPRRLPVYSRRRFSPCSALPHRLRCLGSHHSRLLRGGQFRYNPSDALRSETIRPASYLRRSEV